MIYDCLIFLLKTTTTTKKNKWSLNDFKISLIIIGEKVKNLTRYLIKPFLDLFNIFNIKILKKLN